MYFRRFNEPKTGAHVCSCHFVEEKKQNGPTVLLYRLNQFDIHHLHLKKNLKKLLQLYIQLHMRNMSDQIDFSQTSDKIDADVPIKPEIINDIMDLSLKPSPSSKLVI